MPTLSTLAALADDLAAGRTSAVALTERCLERIHEPAGQGSRCFLRVYDDAARQSAQAMDLLRRCGRAPGPYAGIPISIKDLFDVAGEVTTAGSRLLARAAPATRHAMAVQRLLAAGLVLVGRTNMTEFAFSGLGLNPHHGTPLTPWRRDVGHVPGGSSSGAAVSVADGMADAALGTDTGGSCRIPAAACGLVGFKPTARRVPLDGVFPLSPSLDSVGPIARSVRCCAILDAILTQDDPAPTCPLSAPPVRGLRFGVPTNGVLDGMDGPTARSFDQALRVLRDKGALLEQRAFPTLDQIADANRLGGFAAVEAWRHHRPWLQTQGDAYDPRVRVRMQRGADQSAADYVELLDNRTRIRRANDEATAGYDALLMPTIPIAPPPVLSLADDAEYARVNMLMLRNTALINFLDRCAISIPMHQPGTPPAGLMVTGATNQDRRLLTIALGVEQALACAAACSEL